VRERLGWLLAPAVRMPERPRDASFAALRVLLGLLWLYNLAWKRAPDFGEEADNGLYHFTALAVEHPVLPPYSWLVEELVLPNITVFGYGVLLVETTLAVLLLTGTAVRAAALLGIAQSLAITLSVAFAPGEWPWAYWLMIGAHGMLLLGTPGRAAAVDAVRAGLSPATGLLRAVGVVGLVAGGYSALASLDDPLAARGPGLRSTDLSMSLGQYNLLGGAVVLACSLLLLLASVSGGSPGQAAVRAGQAAAVLGGLGALSLHVQLGYTDPFLGGTPTSAAFLLTLAVVGLAPALARKARG
jgi:hypothetical protein